MKLAKFIVALNIIALAAVAVLSGCSEDDPSPAVSVNAGADQTISLGQAATLDASASGPAGSTLVYLWEIIDRPAGSTVTISNPAVEDITFTPDMVGSFTLRLNVSTTEGESNNDEVIIIVEEGNGPVEIGGTISSDLTLVNRFENEALPDYIASTHVIVDAKLTIQPGVKIIFANDIHMDVDDGALSAVGTEAEPIVFTGATESKGFWKGLFFFSNDVNNVLDHVEVHYAGSSARGFGLPASAIGVNGGDRLSITNSTVTNSGEYGLFVEINGRLASFSNNSFENNNGIPLSMPANEVSSLDAASTFTSNGNQHVEIQGSTLDNSGESEWGAFDDDTPYLVTGNLSVESGLKITAGASFYFASDVYMQLDATGYVDATGTATDRVRFLGANETSGSWQGIHIFTNDTRNKFDYVEVAHGGSSARGFGLLAANIAIDNGDQLSLTNSLIRNSGEYGVYVEKNAALGTFSNNEFKNNGGLPLALDANQVSKIDAASLFHEGNGDNSVEILSSTLEQGVEEVSWQALSNGTPYYVSGGVNIESGLIMHDGLHMEVGTDIVMYVEGDGYLSAQGTASAGITITGKTKAKGAWRGLVFYSNDVRNTLEHVTVSHGGSADIGFGMGKANVAVNNGDMLQATNCTFTQSAGYGLFIESGANFTGTGNSFSNNTLGNTN